MTDNTKQSKSADSNGFALQYAFILTIASPSFPQANGATESGLKLANRMLQQADIFLATGVNPSEHLIGRRIKTILFHPNKL